MVSCGPGSATVSPLIRRALKSGVGAAGVGANAEFSTISAAWLVARRRNAAQIDNAIAFHMVKAQSDRLEFSVAPSGYCIFCLFNRIVARARRWSAWAP